MTRSTLSTINREQSGARVARVVEFIEVVFPSDTIRLTSAGRRVSWGGMTFLPTPPITEIGAVTELATLKSSKTSIKLSGLDEDLLTKVLNENYHFARVAIWEGYCDESWELLTDPHVIVDELLMSVGVIYLDEGSQMLELTADGWELFGLRDAAVLATPEAQHQRYEGDTGLDRVISIQTEEIAWGGSFQRS